MFFIKKSKNAFTLIEIIVVITLIGIFAISINNINLTKSTDKQRINIFTNKIITTFENVRNNSLLGKSVNAGFPMYKAKVNFTTLIGSGELNISYNTGSSLPFTTSPLSIIPNKNYSISNIKCLLIDGTLDTPPTTSSGTINITGNEFTLNGCPSSSKILKITTTYKGIKKYIMINIVNGLVTTN